MGGLHQDVQRTELRLLEAERLADAALEAVAVGSVAGVLPGHEQSETRRAGVSLSKVEDEPVEPATGAAAQQALEVRFAAQPAIGVQREALLVRGYSPMRRRPLARRALRTLRPPTLRLRTRKPCVRARRVFEGW